MYQDLTGQRFGRLVLLNQFYFEKNRMYWECQCDCGNEKIVKCDYLKSGDTLSCGCLNRELSSKRSSGKNSNFWRGGIAKQKYPSEWTDELRESIRNRDNRKCQFQDCAYDDTKENRKLNIHHIDGEKNNCEPYNLISLCGSHHQSIERNNPELWIDYFYQITGDFYGS